MWVCSWSMPCSAIRYVQKWEKANQHVSFQNPACLVKSDNWCMVYHGWWFQTSILFSIIYGYIWDVILPIDELISFRGVAQPPSSLSWFINIKWFNTDLDLVDFPRWITPTLESQSDNTRIVSIFQQVLWGAKQMCKMRPWQHQVL